MSISWKIFQAFTLQAPGGHLVVKHILWFTRMNGWWRERWRDGNSTLEPQRKAFLRGPQLMEVMWPKKPQACHTDQDYLEQGDGFRITTPEGSRSTISLPPKTVPLLRIHLDAFRDPNNHGKGKADRHTVIVNMCKGVNRCKINSFTKFTGPCFIYSMDPPCHHGKEQAWLLTCVLPCNYT